MGGGLLVYTRHLTLPRPVSKLALQMVPVAFQHSAGHLMASNRAPSQNDVEVDGTIKILVHHCSRETTYCDRGDVVRTFLPKPSDVYAMQ
ncbi:hypothetical protein Plhal304r1_c013g0049681 [Plasmopara halstedii]